MHSFFCQKLSLTHNLSGIFYFILLEIKIYWGIQYHRLLLRVWDFSQIYRKWTPVNCLGGRACSFALQPSNLHAKCLMQHARVAFRSAFIRRELQTLKYRWTLQTRKKKKPELSQRPQEGWVCVIPVKNDSDWMKSPSYL